MLHFKLAYRYLVRLGGSCISAEPGKLQKTDVMNWTTASVQYVLCGDMVITVL